METVSRDITFNFSPDVVEAFTFGDCWVLAQAIERATGYPLVSATYGKDFWIHVGNRLPSGLILDIEGTHAETGWLECWREILGDDGGDDVEMYTLSWTHKTLHASILDGEIDPAYPEYHPNIPEYIRIMLELITA